MPSAIPDPPHSGVYGRRAHIIFLDHIRAIAILAVFLLHVLGAAFHAGQLPWVGWHRGLTGDLAFDVLSPCSLGAAGVPIFFVVSGFCIHLSFVSRPDWREFWVRRFFRIYPPYLLALLIFALIFPGTRFVLWSRLDLEQLGTHLALVHNLGNRTMLGINPPFWSIGVEAQLYLIYPILLVLAKRAGWLNALIVTGCVEIGLRVLAYNLRTGNPDDNVFENVPNLIVGSPFFYWLSWSLGAYLAEAYVRQHTLPFARIPIFLVATAAVLAELIKPLSIFSFTVFSLLTAVVIARLLAREGPSMGAGGIFARWLATIGVWSYGIYLLHFPILYWAADLLRNHLSSTVNHPAIIFCLLLIVGVCLLLPAWAWHRCIELPAIALGKGFTPRILPHRAEQRLRSE